eukprot:8745844-Heterocapsa_arctica.AAC.1
MNGSGPLLRDRRRARPPVSADHCFCEGSTRGPRVSQMAARKNLWRLPRRTRRRHAKKVGDGLKADRLGWLGEAVTTQEGYGIDCATIQQINSIY